MKEDIYTLIPYWDIGHEILEKQDAEGWGSKIVERMSIDLRAAFPTHDILHFSKAVTGAAGDEEGKMI